MSKLAIKRYIWLIDTVYQSGAEGITYEEICKQWENCSLATDKSYPLRTFHNHRQEIRDAFNIAIQCRKSTNSYFISDNNDNNSLIKKLLALVSMTHFAENCQDISNHIQAEQPFMGEQLIATTLPAIANYQILRVEYQPYWSEKKLIYPNFEPYGLKEFKNSWYLLGKRSQLPLEMIDLKCVISLTNSEERFEVDTQIDVKKVLVENFGSSIEDIPTEEMMIKVSAKDAGFLRSNPIHVSQKEIEKKKNYSIFYFYLKPNADFKKEILSFGSAVEILMPEGFKRSIVQEVKKMVKRNQ